jgi:hypothetical protein
MAPAGDSCVGSRARLQACWRRRRFAVPPSSLPVMQPGTDNEAYVVGAIDRSQGVSAGWIVATWQVVLLISAQSRGQVHICAYQRILDRNKALLLIADSSGKCKKLDESLPTTPKPFVARLTVPSLAVQARVEAISSNHSYVHKRPRLPASTRRSKDFGCAVR